MPCRCKGLELKTTLAAACLLWMSTAVEMAWPSALPHGAVLLPVACGVIFWTRSSVGLILSSAVLLLDWIARPTLLPLCPMILPIVAVLCIAPSIQSDDFGQRRFSLRVPVPLLLPALTLIAVVLQTVSSIPFPQFTAAATLLPFVTDRLQPLAIMALPFSAGISLLIRCADEFGLRRSFS